VHPAWRPRAGRGPGEGGTLEEMGGARMHTAVSGCGHFLVEDDADAIDLARRYLSFMPGSWREGPPPAPPAEPAPERRVAEIVPGGEKAAFDGLDLGGAVVDGDRVPEV